MTASPQPPEATRTLELVRRLQSGEEGAWDELYASYRDELLFYVRARLGRRLRSALESEDVLQSVALAAFRALPRFEPRGAGSLRRFLHTLVLNKLRDRADALNAVKRAGGVALTDSVAEAVAAPGSTEPVYSDPIYERMERVLESMQEPLREILILRRVEGLSSREVAERLGTSDDAVRKAYSRALAHMALRLGEPERPKA